MGRRAELFGKGFGHEEHPSTGKVQILTQARCQANLQQSRSAVIPPLAAIDTIGHSVVDDAAGQFGVFRGQVCALVKRYRQGAEMVTDGSSAGGHHGADPTSDPRFDPHGLSETAETHASGERMSLWPASRQSRRTIPAAELGA